MYTCKVQGKRNANVKGMIQSWNHAEHAMLESLDYTHLQVLYLVYIVPYRS